MTLLERILLYEMDKPLDGRPISDQGTSEPSAEDKYLFNNAIAWLVFLPFATFENVVCLFAIAARRKWKSPDVLFFSIVFNNLLTLLLPVTVYTIFTFAGTDWSEYLAACKFVVWCVISFRIVNVLQLAFLSLDRVWTLKWPGSYTVHNTANQNARTAGLMWLFGISIGTVPVIGWERPMIEECSLVLDTAGAGYTVCVVILLIGSSSVSVCCVVTMVIKIKYGDDIFASTGSKHSVPDIIVENETGERQMNPHESRDLQNRQVCTIVGWVVIVDVLINELPFTVFNFIALRENRTAGAWLQVTITWCNIIFCACVPIMLCTISRRYRLGLKRVVKFLQVALGCIEPPQHSDELVINRQETLDSLDSYRPDDQDEPINFPEPLSQDVTSFDDPERDTGPTPPDERNTSNIHTEAYTNHAYDHDEETARPKRAEMTSQEKRAHYQALGARRKKLLDARDRYQDKGNQSKRKNSRKHRGEPVNSVSSIDNNLLRVDSARRIGLSKNITPAAREVHPKKALATNRIRVPTDNVTILKSFSADDDRLSPKTKKSVLSQRPFHSAEEEEEAEQAAESKRATARDKRPLELSKTALGETNMNETSEKLGEVRKSSSAGSELYDIPEELSDDLLESFDSDSEEISGLTKVPSKKPHVKLNGGGNLTNLFDLRNEDETNLIKQPTIIEEAITDGHKNGSTRKLRPVDLEVPLLSVPLEDIKSPNVFVQEQDNHTVPLSPLVVTVPENMNNSSNDTKMAGINYTKLAENTESLSKHREKKSKKRGAKKERNNRIKLSEEEKVSRGEIFSFELRDFQRLQIETKNMERRNGGESPNDGERDHSFTNGSIKQADQMEKISDARNGLGEKKISAKDLRARFKETKTKTSKVGLSDDNLQKEIDDVIFL